MREELLDLARKAASPALATHGVREYLQARISSLSVTRFYPQANDRRLTPGNLEAKLLLIQSSRERMDG